MRLLIPIFFLFSLQLNAQTFVSDLDVAEDPRGPVELIACSLNLENYGSYKDVASRMQITREDYEIKERAIMRRIHTAHCDVVALQEILGSTENAAQEAIQRIADGLKILSGRNYTSVVGPSNDPKTRVGYLVAESRAKIMNQVSYVNVELPKISENQKQRFFSRGPLELQLEVQPRSGSYSKIVTLVNFHFKSKSTQGGGDPTGLEFEPYRMEMSEAVRRIVSSRHAGSLDTGEMLLLVMGDRNSHFDSASAKILEGKLTLSSFQGTAPCRMSKRGVPLCKPGVAQPQVLFSMFYGNPLTMTLPGTIQYRGVYSWIDDILAPAETLPYAYSAADVEGQYNSGVVYEPKEASDHALVWVGLNW